MAAALLDSGESPPELTELRLCRDVYHCPPSVLDEQDYERIKAHIIVMNVEAEQARRKNG